MAQHQWQDDDEREGPIRFTEFDCPICNAGCPYEDGFADADEISCYYCGANFRVQVIDRKRFKLKEI